MLGKTRKVHFIGIGGSGMSGIAELLANLGYHVTGSDERRSAVTDRLATLGIRIAHGHKAEHVGDADQGHRGAALGQDFDQPFGGEPRQCLGHREARNPKALADQALVQCLAGPEGQGNDGVPEHVGDVLANASPAGEVQTCKKVIGIDVRFHANMLVASPMARCRFPV